MVAYGDIAKTKAKAFPDVHPGGQQADLRRLRLLQPVPRPSSQGDSGVEEREKPDYDPTSITPSR